VKLQGTRKKTAPASGGFASSKYGQPAAEKMREPTDTPIKLSSNVCQRTVLQGKEKTKPIIVNQAQDIFFLALCFLFTFLL
jgi:hypothetical protein